MKNNVMVIGNKIEEVKKEAFQKDTAKNEMEPVLRDTAADESGTVLDTTRETVQEPVYDNEWGNEHSILNKLDEKALADRRFYTRALYMQRIVCNILLDSRGSEPSLLREPIEFMIIDLSMGGIGIICENEIMIGTILHFKLSLDNINYDIMCEVAYCFQNSDKYRAGLRLVNRNMNFMRHLKIFVARLTLQSKYGSRA